MECRDNWGRGVHEDGFGLHAENDVNSPNGVTAWVSRVIRMADPAEAYARELLADRSPQTVAAAARHRLVTLVLDRLGTTVAAVMIETVRRLVDDGWWTTPTAREAVLAVLCLVVVLGVAVLAPALRVAGRPHVAGNVLAAALLAVPASLWIIGHTPKTPLVRIPTVLPVLVVTALAVATHRFLVWRVNRSARHDDWFDRLSGVLEGTHDLPRRTARALADQARSHWRDARAGHRPDATPEAEFGDLDEYAADLAGGRPSPRPLWRRPGVWTGVGAVLLACCAVQSAVDGSPTWETVLLSTLTLRMGFGAIVDVRTWRELRG